MRIIVNCTKEENIYMSPDVQEDLKLEGAPRKVYASDDCVIYLDALPQAEAQPLRCGHTSVHRGMVQPLGRRGRRRAALPHVHAADQLAPRARRPGAAGGVIDRSILITRG